MKRCQSDDEKEEELHRLTVETSELRTKLVEAENEKQVERRLEAIHQKGCLPKSWWQSSGRRKMLYLR